MTDLSTHFPLLVDDEFRLLQHLAPLSRSKILDVGCGSGSVTERLVAQGNASFVNGIDVDEVQLEKNNQRMWPATVAFQRCGAESLPFADASFDGATLFKSLHHVPIAMMDVAFSELRRVMRVGGWVYISEPLYDGPFNDLMRLFHDEGDARASALQATRKAVADGLFRLKRQVQFFAPIAFKDFDDFRERMMNPTHSFVSHETALVESVREAYERYQTKKGASFIRPVRVDLLERT